MFGGSKADQYILEDIIPKCQAQEKWTEAETERIRQFFQKQLLETRQAEIRLYTRWFIGLFTGLCLLAGVSLLFAYNWDALPKLGKVVISDLPLIGVGALAVWVLQKRADSTVWRDVVSVLLWLSIGLGLLVTCQQYQLGGELTDLLRIWFFLGLPVLYVFATGSVFICSCLLAATLYNWDDRMYSSVQYGALLALAALLPFFIYYNFYRADALAKTKLLNWFYPPVLLTLGLFQFADSDLALPGGVLIGASCLILGNLSCKMTYSANPLTYWGLGILLVCGLSFETKAHTQMNYTSASGVLLLIYVLMAALLWLWSARQKKYYLLYPILLFIAAAGAGLAYFNALLATFALLGGGAWLLLAGYRQNRAILLNGGILVIAALALRWLLASDISSLWRGVAFIMVGVGFCVLNYCFYRWRGRVQKSQELAK